MERLYYHSYAEVLRATLVLHLPQEKQKSYNDNRARSFAAVPKVESTLKQIPVLFAALISALIASVPISSLAMDFSIITMDGRSVLLADGPIEVGDSVRYREALIQTPVQPHGARVVVLNSLGGSVSEALAMSAVNAEYVVHMFIADGTSCASACASILYVSGDYRTMAPNGRFGQHSCSRGGVADEECNELIANHAIRHGVAHGAIKAFVTYIPPADILWFSDTDLDCWAISYFPFSEQSEFSGLHPCIIERLSGQKPDGQPAWRVEMKFDGYRAFARSIADDEREFELGLYCDEEQPGQLFLEFDVGGPVDVVRAALTSAHLFLDVNRSVPVEYLIQQADNGFTRATLLLPKSLVLEILTSTDRIGARFDVIPGYSPLVSWVGTETSREALLFVANHCVNRLKQ